MSQKEDYRKLKVPYDPLMNRQNDFMFELDRGEGSSGSSDPGFSTANSAAGGSVANVTLKSEGNATDVWILNFIRSLNWKPKAVGFYLDGRTGYAEFSNLFVNGDITANSGTIGGFKIGLDYIRDKLDSMGLASTATGADDVRFWAGSTFVNRASAPFRVYESGAVAMSNVTVTGGSVEATAITGTIPQSILNYANRGWNLSCTFSASDKDTVNWTAGVIKFSDGSSFPITAGSTGDMPQLTYIYYDSSAPTALQTTTIDSTAIGAAKVLIGVAKNRNSMATFQIFGGSGGVRLPESPLSGASIPLTPPDSVGQLYIRTSNGAIYIATGTNSDADWQLLGSTSVTPRSPSVSDTATVVESITTRVNLLPSKFDSVTITESISLSIV